MPMYKGDSNGGPFKEVPAQKKERYKIVVERGSKTIKRGTFTIMDEGYCFERGIPTREEAEKKIKTLIQYDDIGEIISDGVDEIIDKVLEKYPDVSRDKIATMISENLT
jgi:hypothetical protein